MAKLPGATQDARIAGERYARSQRRANPEERMPLFDHLRKLRNRVVNMALVLPPGMQIVSIQRRAAVSSSLVGRAVPVWRLRLPFRSSPARHAGISVGPGSARSPRRWARGRNDKIRARCPPTARSHDSGRRQRPGTAIAGLGH